MTLLEAAALGLMQALTEFLPVSSSGHLRLLQAFLGVEGEADLLFDLLLHAGTLVAVFVVYGPSLVRILRDAMANVRFDRPLRASLEASEGLRMLAWGTLATIPTGVIGLLLKDVVSGEAISVPVVGGLLIVNGLVLLSAGRVAGRSSEEDRGPLTVAGLGPRQALWIGIAQGIAVLPGISRAGSTITAALWLGVDRMRAAEFSFLLSIPAIVGAIVLEFEVAALRAGPGLWPCVVGATVSAVAGVAALRLLLRLLRRAQFQHFAWYCLLLGAGSLVLYGLGAG